MARQSDPGGPSNYVVAGPVNDEVSAGQAFLVFSNPHLPPECVGHAALEVDVIDGTGEGLAIYPSWPSYATDAQPGQPIGPETLIDNRPRADVRPTTGSRTVWDVTDLVRAWWSARVMPSNGRTVPDGADLVLGLVPTDNGHWTIRTGSPSSPTLNIEATCSQQSN